MIVLPVTYTFMTSFPPQYTPSHEMLHKAAFTVSPKSTMSSMQEHLLSCKEIHHIIITEYSRYQSCDSVLTLKCDDMTIDYKALLLKRR